MDLVTMTDWSRGRDAAARETFHMRLSIRQLGTASGAAELGCRVPSSVKVPKLETVNGQAAICILLSFKSLASLCLIGSGIRARANAGVI